MKHLQRLGDHFEIPLPTEESGYLGRECPNSSCKGYFKIVPGTGLKGVTTCHCPYCGHTADMKEFHTPDQIKYATSVEIRKITDAFAKDLKDLEFDIKPKGPFGIGLSMKVKPGRPHPIHWYREAALETHIECAKCTLKHAVFGVFAFCPDCGRHNSLQILEKNIELLGKMLVLAASAEKDVAEKLVENALEDCVSAFDGFGREFCRVHASRATNPQKAKKINFQNLDGTRANIEEAFGFDLSATIAPQEWVAATRGFQKRHLVAHKMGVVDQEYIDRTGDRNATVGRRITITEEDVRATAHAVQKIANDVIRLSGEIAVTEIGEPVEKPKVKTQIETVIYTIGHSNHPIEKFIGLLKKHNITAVGDVRSRPYSRHNPQFNRETLAVSLKEAGIAYVFLGEELGARPEDPTCYDNGQVDFARMAVRGQFKRGLERVLTGSEKYRLALMCAEKEPLDCHRTILVCHNLKAQGVSIKHILADGSIEEHRHTEARMLKATGCERNLFERGRSDSEIIEQAYAERAREIAYKVQHEGARHDSK
jgi:hypothetical protein